MKTIKIIVATVLFGLVVFFAHNVLTRLKDVEAAQRLDREFLIKYAPQQAIDFQNQLNAAKAAVNRSSTEEINSAKASVNKVDK